MIISIKPNDSTRSDLSLCIEQLDALLETVRRQEAFLYDHRSPYFDETIVIAHCHLDGAMRALRGIVARFDTIDSRSDHEL
jgi:hypothetical protein